MLPRRTARQQDTDLLLLVLLPWLICVAPHLRCHVGGGRVQLDPAYLAVSFADLKPERRADGGIMPRCVSIPLIPLNRIRLQAPGTGIQRQPGPKRSLGVNLTARTNPPSLPNSRAAYLSFEFMNLQSHR